MISATLMWREGSEGTVVAMTDSGGRPRAPRPSLCIVNYNGARFLEATIEAALAEADGFGELLLVDNGSDDDSLAIAARFPTLRVIALGENRGAGAVRNAAIRAAASDLIMLVDSDVRLVPGCTARLTEALARRPDASVAMPRILYDFDRRLVQYDGADFHYLGLQSIRHRDVPAAGLDDAVREIGSVITACVLVDRRTTGLDPFDEDFFIYLEDHDFGVRIRSRGYTLLSVPAARCLHAEGTPGLSIRALGAYSKLRVFCLIRNRWQFIAKNYEARTLLLVGPMFAVYEASQLIAVVKKGWFGEWARALGWMVRHAPDIFRRRREVQTRRTRSDRALLAGGPIPFREELVTGPTERWGREALDGLVSLYWQWVGPLV